MQKPSVTPSTFVIERNYPVTPERVFAAFADPAKKRRWFAEGKDMDVDGFEMDFRVGGSEHSRMRLGSNTPFPGTIITNDTSYRDIVPNRRIVIAYTMTMGDQRMSASQATFEFLPAGEGTDLIFTEQGAFFEVSDGPKMREDGWRKILEHLAQALAG